MHNDRLETLSTEGTEDLLTVLVDRAGLGNGYAVVLFGLSLPAVSNTVSQLLRHMSGRPAATGWASP